MNTFKGSPSLSTWGSLWIWGLHARTPTSLSRLTSKNSPATDCVLNKPDDPAPAFTPYSLHLCSSHSPRMFLTSFCRICQWKSHSFSKVQDKCLFLCEIYPDLSESPWLLGTFSYVKYFACYVIVFSQPLEEFVSLNGVYIFFNFYSHIQPSKRTFLPCKNTLGIYYIIMDLKWSKLKTSTLSNKRNFCWALTLY